MGLKVNDSHTKDTDEECHAFLLVEAGQVQVPQAGCYLFVVLEQLTLLDLLIIHLRPIS